MTKKEMKNLCLGVALGAGAILGIAAATNAREMSVEYQVASGNVHNGELRTQMNKFGGDNWEFVSSSGVGDRYGYAIFKRAKAVNKSASADDGSVFERPCGVFSQYDGRVTS